MRVAQSGSLVTMDASVAHPHGYVRRGIVPRRTSRMPERPAAQTAATDRVLALEKEMPGLVVLPAVPAPAAGLDR